MRAQLLAFIAASGCGFQARNTPTGDATVIADAPTDPDATDAPPADGSGFCFGSGPGFTICVPQAPSGTYQVTADAQLNTDVDCTHVIDGLCIKAAQQIMITALLDVSGSRPLVLLASASISVAGKVDVASHRGLKSGPGANSSACALSTKGGNGLNGGGGGGGGSFGTKGGDGALGDGGNVPRGDAGATTLATTVRGGCKGGNGGAGGAGATGGIGGDGGGAVYFVSGGSMSISGRINASGAGGTASPRPTSDDGGGAGGGGSGGLIAFYAPASFSVVGAEIFANGGGGAEGGDRPNNCDPGDDPTEIAVLVGGAAGAGVCNAGGDGGNGAGGLMPAVAGMSDNEGGGGGGGGGGVIRVVSGQTLTGATVSP